MGSSPVPLGASRFVCGLPRPFAWLRVSAGASSVEAVLVCGVRRLAPSRRLGAFGSGSLPSVAALESTPLTGCTPG